MDLHNQSDLSSVEKATQTWIDITVPMQSSMVCWPGDPQFSIERKDYQMDEQKLSVSTISMGSHTGTHVDAPLHCLNTGSSIEEMPLDATVGLAHVIEIKDTEIIEPAHLADKHIRQGQRVLLKTQNSSRRWQTEKFTTRYSHISTQTALYLVKKGIRSIGIDYLSVGGSQSEGMETHRILLEGGVWIIEGLNLSMVRPGKFHFICLPLKIIGGDGAPARAILKTLFK